MFSQYLSEEEAICMVAVVVIFGFVGLALNVILIFSIILTDGFSDSPANIFVLSLAVADALTGFVCASLYGYNMYNSAFNISLTVGKVFGLATTGSILLLTLNRYISIVRSLRYPTIVTFQRSMVMVGVIWLIAFTVPVFDAVSLIFDKVPDLRMTRYIIAFYIVSTIVLSVSMYNLGRKHAKRMAQQAFAVTGQLQAASYEFRTLRSLFMIAGSFGACWLPLTIQAIIFDRKNDPVLFDRVFCFSSLLPILNTIIDPVVYYFRSKGFRSSLKMLKRRIENSGHCECYSQLSPNNHHIASSW